MIWARGKVTVEGLRGPTLVGKSGWYRKLAEVFEKKIVEEWALSSSDIRLMKSTLPQRVVAVKIGQR